MEWGGVSFGLDIVKTDEYGNEEWVEVVDGHTYNLAPMWRKAMPFIEQTSDLNGRQCAHILDALDAGLLDAVKNADEYRTLEPENGWGDYDGFLRIFARFVNLCNQHPTGVIRWNG